MSHQFELHVEEKKTYYGIVVKDPKTGKTIIKTHASKHHDEHTNEPPLHHAIRHALLSAHLPAGAVVVVKGVPPKTVLRAFAGR
jgi:hypothetical protein